MIYLDKLVARNRKPIDVDQAVMVMIVGHVVIPPKSALERIHRDSGTLMGHALLPYNTGITK